MGLTYSTPFAFFFMPKAKKELGSMVSTPLHLLLPFHLFSKMHVLFFGMHLFYIFALQPLYASSPEVCASSPHAALHALRCTCNISDVTCAKVYRMPFGGTFASSLHRSLHSRMGPGALRTTVSLRCERDQKSGVEQGGAPGPPLAYKKKANLI